MRESEPKTGIVFSSALHACLLAAILFGFAQAPKFDDAAESIPVESITAEQFNQIMKGEKEAKPAKAPVENPAPLQVAAAATTAQAIEPPPPAPKPVAEPALAQEPPAPPVRPEPPKLEPPKAEPPKAEPPKPIAEDAPPEPPAKPKLPEKPPEKPKPPQETPKPVETPKSVAPPKPKTSALDDVEKLLEKTQPQDAPKPSPKPAAKPLDLNAIGKLIGEAKPAPTQSANAANQGLPTQTAPHMSPSLSAALDAWFTDSYLKCWTPPPTMPEGVRYVAQIRVAFNADGSLAAQPVLVNPPSDPAWSAHADSARRAVAKCNPLHVPLQYAPYFEQWKTKTVHFDPQNALG